MNRPLRTILLEDNPDDAELILLELSRAGYAVEATVGATRDDFARALDAGAWDIVLSDFSMPQFSAPAALQLLKEYALDLPFIIISGSVSEQIAVESMRAGAHDFFSKGNLTRLGAAIERELREARIRHERREAVHQLARAEERYHLIVASVKDYAICMLDPSGRVASWNRGAEQIFGYREEEILGESFARFFTDEAQARGEPAAALAGASAAAPHSEEGVRRRKDGSTFWAASSLDVIREGDTLLGYSQVIRDVTERKHLLDHLRQAVKARDEFLSIASHELKTPLTSLVLQAEGLRRVLQAAGESIPTAPLLPRVEVVMRQAERLTTLINNLLDVTRITSGRMELARGPVDLGRLVEETIERSQDAIARSGSLVSLQRSGDSEVSGHWDRLRIEAVVANLLSNALKYGERRPVEITIEKDEQFGRLIVTDHGIGIAPAEQERIFQRFERAVPEHHYGGFGIGLWIVGQVAEAHGGRIRVASEPGRGSTFTVELPLRAP